MDVGIAVTCRSYAKNLVSYLYLPALWILKRFAVTRCEFYNFMKATTELPLRVAIINYV